VKPVTPVGLRPPELILTGTVNNTLDVWSFGCLVFELITGQPLFCVLGYSSPGMEDDDHLLSLTTYLGPLPDELYKHWKKSSFYFTDERELFNCQVQGVYEEREEYEEEEAEAEAEPIIIQQTSMEELFDETNPDLGQDEARQIKLLIRRILQYDPAKRPTPAEILRDPWFCGETEYASSNRSLYGLSSSGLEL
jgi:non-specific serine/threonine protein kinase